MKRLRWLSFGLAGVVALFAIMGDIKFNLLQDDVLLSPSAVIREDLIGDWVEPISGMEGQTQGFTLRDDGSASSINMATLLYRHWRFSEGKLTLAGQPVGNRTFSPFEEVYEVQWLGQKELRLVDVDGRIRKFSKLKFKAEIMEYPGSSASIVLGHHRPIRVRTAGFASTSPTHLTPCGALGLSLFPGDLARVPPFIETNLLARTALRSRQYESSSGSQPHFPPCERVCGLGWRITIR